MLYKASYKPSGRSKDPRFENVTTWQAFSSVYPKMLILDPYFRKHLMLKHDTEKYNMQSNW
jgi:hypothetical protein